MLTVTVVLVKQTRIEVRSVTHFKYIVILFFLICRSTKLVIIERLLLLAERYVITIEVSRFLLLRRMLLRLGSSHLDTSAFLVVGSLTHHHTQLASLFLRKHLHSSYVHRYVFLMWYCPSDLTYLFFKDFYSVPRTILPHGASFHGHLLTLNVTYESTKDTFTVEVSLH